MMTSRRACRLLLSVLTCITLTVVSAEAAGPSAKTLDKDASACLARFYSQVPNAKQLVESSKGVLVMPGVVKAGFLVAGEFGQGVLRVDSKTVGYYNLISGSVGFVVGAEKMDIIIIFRNDEALNKFKNTQGWEAGADANVAVVNKGVGNSVDWTKMYDPIIAFVFSPKGLMADASLKGGKFTEIHPK